MIYALFLALLLAPALAGAETYSVPLTTTPQQQQGLIFLYTSSCNDRVRATPPLAALGGCTVAGTGETATCTCTPNATQVQGALSVFLEQQLFNRYFSVLDREAGEVRSKYSTLTQAQRDAIKAQCPTCTF